MASSIETGHAINIANFRALIDHAVALGTDYTPTNAALAIVNMNGIWTQANTAHGTLNTTLIGTKLPINEREDAFEPLDKLVTRTLNYYMSTEALEESKRDAKGLADKIRGHRVHAPLGDDGTPLPDWVSNSHRSYVQRLNNFRQLIALYVSDSPNYAPSTDELSTGTLTALADALEAHNNTVEGIMAPVTAARDVRNNLLYAEETGMLALAEKVKKYSKSLPATHAGIIAAIQKIRFTKPKK